MSTNTSSNTSTVFIVPIKKGRPRKFGSLAFIEGRACFLVGYTADGQSQVFVQREQIAVVRGAVDKTVNRPIYRIIKKLMKRYELENGLLTP